MKRALTLITLSALTALGCATNNLESLKPTLNAFYGKMRWKDYRQIPPQLMPERRDAFRKATEARDDEKNLVVTDYTLEDCELTDPNTAVCYAKVSWYRLPSATEKTVTVATTMRWINGAWLVDKQNDGPFAESLTVGDAGVPAAQNSTP